MAEENFKFNIRINVARDELFCYLVCQIAVWFSNKNNSKENPVPGSLKEEKLSQTLAEIAQELGEREVKFRELVNATRGRGYDLLLVILSLPFLTPISLIGISTPFGLAITFAGLRMSLGKKPWWPDRILEKPIPHSFFPKLLKFTIHICRGIEFFSKPRLHFFHNLGLFQRIAGMLIAISGILLALPLPLPLSNTLPAITILLFAISAMEKDGIIFVIASFSFVFMLAYYLLLIIGGVEIIHLIKKH